MPDAGCCWSPNQDERPAGAVPNLLVLHYTGMPSAEAALARLRDPAAKVSAHHLIDEDGTLVPLVPEARRAWHAGLSHWQGRDTLNDVSIGIELVNPGHAWGYRAFPEAQMASLEGLARAILARWPIPPERIVAHSDIAPTRKEDPGELFDWARLARAGIGLWPRPATPCPPDEGAARALLAGIGYPLEPQGSPLAATLAAFQRRFRPSRCDGALDPDTMGVLREVGRLYGGRAAPR